MVNIKKFALTDLLDKGVRDYLEDFQFKSQKWVGKSTVEAKKTKKPSSSFTL